MRTLLLRVQLVFVLGFRDVSIEVGRKRLQELPETQLKTLIEQGDIEAALQLLAAVETWPQEAAQI